MPDDRHEALDAAIAGVLSIGPDHIVVKRGPAGATIVTDTGHTDIPGFPVDVVNTVGAGDSFASGLIARRLYGDTWEQAVRYGNACGAITVTRHGCSVAFPTHDEVEAFVAEKGGW